MKTIGFDRLLYILPFDHRGSFETKMFGGTAIKSLRRTACIGPSITNHC
jgi:hypothetical protein